RKVVEKGVPSQRVYVIPHWADGEIYRPLPRDETLADRLGWSKRFVVFYAGNVGRLQGLENLIQAAGLLDKGRPELLVAIMGEGVEKERLRAIVTQRQMGNVVFIDSQPPHQVAVHSSLADVLYVGLVSNALSSLSMPSKVQT